MKVLTYSEMLRYSSFEDRFNYLNLHGVVCEETFGTSRYLNQQFYHSPEWRQLRHEIITRDRGCDLAVEDRLIYFRPVIHHINPMTLEELLSGDPRGFDPENLITVSQETHRAIHYGSFEGTPQDYSPRRAGDTCPWKELS